MGDQLFAKDSFGFLTDIRLWNMSMKLHAVRTESGNVFWIIVNAFKTCLTEMTHLCWDKNGTFCVSETFQFLRKFLVRIHSDKFKFIYCLLTYHVFLRTATYCDL